MTVTNVLYLSQEGDSVKISSWLKNQTAPAEPAPEQIDSRIRTLQERATKLKTHEFVLEFLKEVQVSADSLPLEFYHTNNPNYRAHMGLGLKGLAHKCDLNEQIQFVRYKIQEGKQGLQQSSWWCSVL